MATLEIDGQSLHYVAEGNGSPAIVFIHGFSCSHIDWRQQLDHFASSHRVIAVDLRGHGQSRGFTNGFDIQTLGSDICTLIENLDLGPAVLVGHSLGCRVVMEAASERPDLVAGVIMVDGSRSAEGDREAAEYHARDMIEEAGGIEAMRTAMFEAMFVEGSDQDTKQSILERAASVDPAIGESLWISMLGYDAGMMEGALSGIECPVLVIQSTDRNPDKAGRRSLRLGDTTNWTKTAERIVGTIQTEVVPDIGHFTMLDAPARTNELIASLLAKL